jgi:hypothetical protein
MDTIIMVFDINRWKFGRQLDVTCSVKRELDTKTITELLSDRIYPDRFYWEYSFVLSLKFAATLGVSEILPVCSFVARPLKTVFYKCLDQYRAITVAIQPIFGSSYSTALRQDSGSESKVKSKIGHY